MLEWLTVIVVLLLIAVILDGLRRMRQSRRSSIKMSRSVHKKKGIKSPEGEEYGSELPNGGARVVSVQKPQDATRLDESLSSSAAKKRTRKPSKPGHYNKKSSSAQQRIPEQVALNLEESVPMLMDSVENRDHSSAEQLAEPTKNSGDVAKAQPSNIPSTKPETSFDSIQDIDEKGRIEPQIGFDDLDDEVELVVPKEHPAENAESTAVTEVVENIDTVIDSIPDADEILGLKPYSEIDDSQLSMISDELSFSGRIPSHSERTSLFDDNPVVSDTNDVADTDSTFEEQAEENYIEPELVLVINVMARSGEKLPGSELLQVLLDQEMRFGNMDIFHRHAGRDGSGKILYSMANILVPGTFDLKNIKNMFTPGVSLFLALPLPQGHSSLEAFNKMVETARAISSRLGAVLKDENRSVLTTQTIEHYRQSIREFERKQLSKAPA